ncbi:uncharacterized protein LOC117807118 [Xyrichtys novacula]|uniref:Uncharacterized protein LOC117807118 n=1 Tax=Xyrichtys novacula TaxID=13765 RepID=A0AAV1HNQ7_XYRNO|nr:uncharacterized protein LOC117807118 [Xyrichtys novacula]
MLGFYFFIFLLRTAEGILLYADPGQNVTLRCFPAEEAQHLCWYKQVAGEQPQMISYYYKHSVNPHSFNEQFKDNRRFSVQTGKDFYHLNILNVQDSDSAMYYCGHILISATKYDEGIYLVLRGSSHRSYILQPASDSVKQEGSVTLTCAVHNGTCDGEQSVYWFKKDSGSSHTGIMYIPAQSSRQCGLDRGSEPPERRCVYSLSKRNVSRSDAGTYYCAVAHCGDILFGGGTRLDVKRKHDEILVYCMVAVLFVSITLNLILIIILCKTNRKKLLLSEGLQLQCIQEFTPDSQNTDVDALQYVALDFKKGQSKRRQRGPEEETIYSGLRDTN